MDSAAVEWGRSERESREATGGRGVERGARADIHLLWFALWAVWNAALSHGRPFDPFPFPILTTILAMETILQKLGLTDPDPEVAALKQSVEPEQLMEQLEQQVESLE